MKDISRRRFVRGSAVAAASMSLPLRSWAGDAKFHVGVISDEISQDFDHACYVITKEYGLHFVELREVWGKNLQEISDAQIADAQKIIAKYGLQVTDIASPLYKVDFPGAPHSQYGFEGRFARSCRVYLQAAGRCADAVDCAGQRIQDEQSAVLRFLADRRCEAVSRGDQ